MFWRTTGAVLSILAVIALTALVVLDDPTPTDTDRIYAAMNRIVAQKVAQDAERIFGDQPVPSCISTHELAMCIHPDTPPERVAEIMRTLPTFNPDKYNLGTRWSHTAIDGDVNANAPINLTYSFLPDGTWIPGGDEPGSASSLYAEMNSHFGSESVWKPMFAQMFNDWGSHIGVTYQEVSDDGASFPGSAGEVGLRGDVRIGAHPIDGGYGVLAYNYYPDRGDMVLDTYDNWGNSYNNYIFMRNVLRHEHGHGLGLGHVTPENCQKLMEAYLCQNFDGPQDDDIRGGMRFYGDTYEFNNSAANATDLGVLEGTWSPAQPVSITSGVDYDYYRFTTAGAALVSVTVDPVGYHYNLEGEIIDTDEIMDLAFRVLGGTNGSNNLIQVNGTGLGEDEMLVDFALPEAGDYWVLVFRAGGFTDLQRYDIDIDVELTGITAAGDVPVADLGATLYPNPFNPQTAVRFYAAQAGPVSVDVFNVRGERVRRLHDDASSAGWQELTWDGRNDAGGSVASGSYLLRVEAGGRVQTVRGLLVE